MLLVWKMEAYWSQYSPLEREVPRKPGSFSSGTHGSSLLSCWKEVHRENSLKGIDMTIILPYFQPGALWRLVSSLIFDCFLETRTFKEDLWNASVLCSDHSYKLQKLFNCVPVLLFSCFLLLQGCNWPFVFMLASLVFVYLFITGMNGDFYLLVLLWRCWLNIPLGVQVMVYIIWPEKYVKCNQLIW